MIICKKQTTDLQEGVQNLIDTMVEDYDNSGYGCAKVFANKFKVTQGKKYIKVVAGDGVAAFIVKADDKRFRKGDILKPASWSAPARNSARGNVLIGNFPMNWTGPLYLK